MGPLTPEAALTSLLEEGRARAVRTDPAQARLWDALATAAEGGKRFRPALVMAAHAALAPDSPDASVAVAARVAAAVELLHTAFVVHDDIIDGDEVRRGRLNVSGTYAAAALADGATPEQAHELGLAAGILAGDLALAAAVRAVATCGADVAVTHRLLDLFDGALHVTACGELADVTHSLHLGAATLEESLRMEEQKTSAYSFTLPLQAGAVLAGADEQTVARLGEAGRRMGIAFQLLDDLVGVFGDPAATGKSATSDLRSGKQTPLLVHATTTPEWAVLRDLVGRDLSDDELAEARRLLTASGSRDVVERLVETELAAARQILAELGVEADLLEAVGASLPGLRTPEEAAA